MSRRTAFLIFFFGTQSSAVIFLLLTIDFHRKKDIYTNTDQLTEQVVAGKKVWRKYNCNDCHTILGFGAYYAPDMTKAFFRLGKSNIIAIVTHPEEVYKNSFRKMPNLGVTEKEAQELVEFLKWTGNIENRHWPPQDEKYIQAYRMRETAAQVLTKTDIVLVACGGCHAFENQGRDVAGDFNDIAKETKYDRDTLVKLMLDPDSVDPDLGMPAQDISRETAQLIADFILPEETKGELYSTKIAWAQLIIFTGTAVVAVVGFLFGWTQGTPLLEIPPALDLLIVVAALMFVFNVGMTVFKSAEKSLVQWMLFGGVAFLAVLYLFGHPFYKSINTEYYYWWWVIHLWVEGAWELITAAIMAFILIKVTGVERKVVEKWLYVETGVFLFTGIVRNRASLLLDRRARLLAVVGWNFQRAGAAAGPSHGSGHLAPRERADQTDGQPFTLDLHRGHVDLPLPGSRRVRVHPHPPPHQLLYPREPDHGVPRAPGFLRGLRAS